MMPKKKKMFKDEKMKRCCESVQLARLCRRKADMPEWQNKKYIHLTIYVL